MSIEQHDLSNRPASGVNLAQDDGCAGRRHRASRALGRVAHQLFDKRERYLYNVCDYCPESQNALVKLAASISVEQDSSPSIANTSAKHRDSLENW
jgi:hypothetical protein